MSRFKIVMTIICLSLAAVAFAPAAKADGWNKKTVVTFSQPIEIPGGVILPAGTYVFKLVDTISDRHIVRVLNEAQTHVYATIIAIPNYRLQATDKTVMTFGESPVGVPQAIRAWFYPGANSGEEFVYPKRRAMELARVTSLPVLAMPTELEPVITQPPKSESDAPVVALRDAPVTAVKPTGEAVEIAEVVTPPPPQQTVPEQQTATRYTPQDARRLPQTASPMPLIGLLGMLSLGAAFALWVFPKFRAQAKIAK